MNTEILINKILYFIKEIDSVMDKTGAEKREYVIQKVIEATPREFKESIAEIAPVIIDAMFIVEKDGLRPKKYKIFGMCGMCGSK